MRQTTPAAFLEIAKKTGTEPVIFLDIQWKPNAPFVRYSTKEMDGVISSILSIGDVDTAVNLDSSSSSVSISVTLNDTKGEIKAIMDTQDIHKRPCIVYYWIDGLALSDAFEVFRGQISSPVVWDSAAKNVSFDILDRIYTTEVGFSIEQGQYDDFPDESLGKAWPTCFGECMNVPAVKATPILTGQIAKMFGTPDPVLELRKFQLQTEMNNFVQAYSYFVGLLNSMQPFISPQFVTKQVIKFYVPPAVDWNMLDTFVLEYEGAVTPPLTYRDIFYSNNEHLKTTAISGISNNIFEFELDNAEYIKSTIEDSNVITITVKYVKPKENPDGLTFYEFATKDRPSLYKVKSFSSVKVTVEPKSIITPNAVEEIDFENYSALIQRRAMELQEEYAEIIVDEDTIKQRIEDMNTTLDGIQKIYDGLVSNYNDDPSDADNNTKLKNVQEYRNALIEQLYIASQQLTSKTYIKEKIEVDTHNAKYVYEAAKTIKGKCKSILTEYVKLKKKYDQLLRVMKQQDDLLVKTGRINNGYRFPQNETLDLNISGVKVRGLFDGNEFTLDSVLPSYTAVTVIKPKDDDLDAFWLQGDVDSPNDPSTTDIDLTGHYCQLANGFIIQVIDQTDGKCRFNLISKKSNIRNSPDDFTFMGLNSGQIKDAFADVITGEETFEQLAAIASSIPRDISKKIYKILSGNADTQYLYPFIDNSPYPYWLYAIEPHPEKFNRPLSTFQIVYNDQATDRIPIGATAGEIKAAIIAGTELLDSDIFVTFQKATYISGKLSTYVNDAKATFLYHNNDNNSKDEYTSDDQIRLQIIFNDPAKMYPIEVKSYDIITLDGQVHDVGKEPIPPKSVYIHAYIDSKGAHEYTVAKRNMKIETSVMKSVHDDELEDIKKAIKKATAAIIEETATPKGGNAKQIADLRAIIQAQEARFTTLMKNVQIPKDIITEANRQISDTEYKVLFALEILRYMAWQHGLDPVEPEFPDPHLQYTLVGSDIYAMKQPAIRATSPTILREWLQPYKVGSQQDVMEKIQALPESKAFVAGVGTDVKEWGEYKEVHVANIVPSQILGVFAFKTDDGLRTLQQLPERYYDKNESNSEYGKYSATTITLKKPLNEYPGENWDTQIYVSLVSSIGPNPVSIMNWVLANFTSLSLDPSTANDVANSLANYPMNFALLDKMDALTLVKDLAYQSRCAAWLVQNKVRLMYLPVRPPSVFTFTDSNVKFGSVSMHYTDTDEAVTKYVAEYQGDYSKDKKNRLILRFNVNKLSEIEEVVSYYGYNQRSLVEKSATFWLIRRSNVWKIARFTAYLDAIRVEPFDCVTLNFAKDYFSTGPCQGIVQSVNVNYESKTIDYEVWLPIISGEMTEHTFAWPAGLTEQDVYPREQDIIDGNAGSPFNESVPTGSSYDPFSVNVTNIRPRDYGDITPTDLTDTLPASIIAGTSEVAQPPIKIENFDPEVPEEKEDRKEEVAVGNEAAIPDFKPEAPATPNVMIGRVVRKNALKSFKAEWAVLPGHFGGGSDEALASYKAAVDASLKTCGQWYDLKFPDGTLRSVKIVQMHAKDSLPENMALYCVLNPVSGEWEAQPPVWTSPSPELS